MARLFVLIPVLLEVGSLLLVGQIFGPLTAILAVLAGAVVGGFILTRLGRAFFADLDIALKSGQPPQGPLLRALCLLGAGVLFMTPGFVSDLVALVLLFPGLRALMAPLVWRQIYRPGSARQPRQPRWTGRQHSGQHSQTAPSPILEGDYKDVTDRPKDAETPPDGKTGREE